MQFAKRKTSFNCVMGIRASPNYRFFCRYGNWAIDDLPIFFMVIFAMVVYLRVVATICSEFFNGIEWEVMGDHGMYSFG